MLDTLLLSLLGGYFYLSTRYKYQWLTLRQSSYHLFFRSALWGLMFFGLARLMVLLAVTAVPEAAGAWAYVESYFVPDEHRAYAGTALLSLTLGVVVGRVLNFIGDEVQKEVGNDTLSPGSKIHASYNVIAERGSELERMVTRAFRYERLLSVTLSTDKYYIGIMANTPEPDREYRYLKLLPASSGYRDPVTKELRETTSYREVRQAIEEEAARREAGQDVDGDPIDLETEDYAVIVPVGQIASVSIFDPRVYRKFLEANRASAEAEAAATGGTVTTGERS